MQAIMAELLQKILDCKPGLCCMIKAAKKENGFTEGEVPTGRSARLRQEAGMTVKEVEECTGLARSNIRFYEKEGLLIPERRKNGYREYSAEDVRELKKIACLRSLGISLEDIRKLQSGQAELRQAVEWQREALRGQLGELSCSEKVCERMLSCQELSYETFQGEQFLEEPEEARVKTQPVFQLDTVSFLYVWGSFALWAAMALLALFFGIFFYRKLPPQIPVQWSGGEAVSLVNRAFIFAYPAACVLLRLFLRPVIYGKMGEGQGSGQAAARYHACRMLITEYLTNYLCFLALSGEIFTLLFVYGLVRRIEVLLITDTVVLLGLLCVGLVKMDLKERTFAG